MPVSDSWNVSGFIRICQWLLESQCFLPVCQWLLACQWFYPSIWVVPRMSVVLSGYISDTWNVTGFIRVYQWLLECEWFYPGISVTAGMSVVWSGYVSDSWNVSVFIRLCQWLLECQWFYWERCFSPPIKTDHNNINGILFKVWLNTHNRTDVISPFNVISVFVVNGHDSEPISIVPLMYI